MDEQFLKDLQAIVQDTIGYTQSLRLYPLIVEAFKGEFNRQQVSITNRELEILNLKDYIKELEAALADGADLVVADGNLKVIL